MKRIVLTAAAVAALVVIGSAIGLLIYARSHGFSARPEPSSTEAALSRRLRAFAVPGDVRQARNPEAATPQALAEAMSHFADHCAVCHANDGSGDTVIGNGLFPRPPDMRLPATQSLTDGELYYAIHNGIRFTGMPAFGEDKAGLADADSWKLVHFIRRLPSLSETELQSMKEMNPRTPAEFEQEERVRRFLAGEDVEAPASSSGHGHD